MIAYNTTLLEHTFLVSEATDLKKSNFITQADLDEIKNKLETLKTSKNIFVRLGFFLLGILLLNSIMGFLFLTMLHVLEEEYFGFVYALIGFFLLELLCNQSYFRHGLDDAFLIVAQTSFYISVFILTKSQIAVTLSMIIVGLFCCIRYVNTVSFLVFLFGIVLLVGLLLINYTTISSVLPFVLLCIAFGFYCIYQKIKNSQALYFYHNVLQWFFIFSFLLGYVSINYHVVRTLSEELLHADYSKSKMPFEWVFNGLMFLLPIIYIIYALKIKNRAILYIAGLTFVLSVATFRYYHSIMPAEWALILAGLVIFSAVFFIIQKTKFKTTGVTFQPDHNTNTKTLNTTEALIVNSQDMHHAQGLKGSNMPFGGGGFSGGGAGESF